MAKQTPHSQIATWIRANPTSTFWEVALALNVSLKTITTAAKKYGLSRPSPHQTPNQDNGGAK